MMVKKNYFNIFKNGSVSTRLSYVIMGLVIWPISKLRRDFYFFLVNLLSCFSLCFMALP